MLKADVLFSNKFGAVSITPSRLYAFGMKVLPALKLANEDNKFDTIIASLTTALTALLTELSDVDVNLGTQKVSTQTVDEFISGFSAYMSDNEGVIAKALGGKKSGGFREFYQFGLTQYSKANRTTMPLLTQRVAKLAVKYDKALGTEMSGELQAFATDYETRYDEQQSKIHVVKTDRGQRSTAFIQTQMTLTNCVHTVALAYLGDVNKCASFFPFSLLYPQSKKMKYTLLGKLSAGVGTTLLNRTLTKNVEISLLSTGDLGQYAFWAADDPNKEMPEDATIVNAVSAAILLNASQFGDLQKNTFFMVKNLSDVSTCEYKISFTGLRNPVKSTKQMTVIEEELDGETQVG